MSRYFIIKNRSHKFFYLWLRHILLQGGFSVCQLTALVRLNRPTFIEDLVIGMLHIL